MEKSNGNTRHFRNKTVCVGRAERTLVVSIFLNSFVLLCCAVPVSTHYGLCSVTFRMKELQNWRLVRFSVKDKFLVRVLLGHL